MAGAIIGRQFAAHRQSQAYQSQLSRLQHLSPTHPLQQAYHQQSLASAMFQQQTYTGAQNVALSPAFGADALRNAYHYRREPPVYLPVPYFNPKALRRPKWQRRALVALALIFNVDRILPMGRILRS